MSRTYATEFPDFTSSDIPAELLDPSQWEDMSWHNETSPRFMSVATRDWAGVICRVSVWVEKPNRVDREDESYPRYSVSLRDASDDEAVIDSMDDEDWTLALRSIRGLLPEGR